jgi:hypothetical protein
MSFSIVSYTTTPPGGPVDGQYYIVKAVGTGVWTGFDNQIAYYNISDYVFSPPLEGMELTCFDGDGAGSVGIMVYTGGFWVFHANSGGSFAGSAAGGDLSGTYPNPQVSAMTVTGPTAQLVIGAVADGQYLKRVGVTLVGSTVSGSGDVVGPASAVNNNIAVFDGVTGKLIKDGGATIASLGSTLQEYTTDPVSPTAGQTWVLKTPAWVAIGQPIGLLLALTYAENQIDTYQFSFQTLNGYTKRVTVQ